MPDDRVGLYALEIGFEPATEDPGRIFRSMSGMISAFQRFDAHLAWSIAAEIEPVLVLETVEAGSLRTWLATVLRTIDDSSLKKLDWRGVVGTYLVRAKRRVVGFLDGKSELRSRADIEVLEGDLLDLAQQTNVREIPTYSPVPLQALVSDLSELASALAPLRGDDRVSYRDVETSVLVNHRFSVPPDAIEELIAHDVIANTINMILRVKRPDYLGRSMWEFRHEGRVIPAKILDQPWLDEFQARRVLVRPGDSLRVQAETRVLYDRYGEVLATQYVIHKVLGVIPAPDWQQRALPE